MSRAVVDAKEFSHAMSKISKILKSAQYPFWRRSVSGFRMALHIDGNRSRNMATAELPASGDDMFFVFRKTKDILRACSHFAGELTMEFSERGAAAKSRKDSAPL